MLDGLLLTGKMPKGIDGVERSIIRLIDWEIAHVSDKRRGFDLVPLEPLVAKVDRLGVQIQASAVIAPFDHPVKQSPSPTGRFQ